MATAKKRKVKKTKARAARRKAKPARRPARRPAAKAARRPAAKRTAVKKRPVRGTKKKGATKKKKARIKIKVKMPQPQSFPWREPLPGETLIGVVDDFLTHLSVTLVTLQAPLAVGDTIHVRGFTTDLTEKVSSLQIEHQPVAQANAGQDVGIRMVGKVRKHDHIYKVNAPAPAAQPPQPQQPPQPPVG